MHKPRITARHTARVRTERVADRRITGAKLQERRFAMWQASPVCAGCQRIVEYPGGFELDHIVPLSQGGEDTSENCQLLCVWTDTDGKKRGCHAEKTAREVGGK